MMMMIIVLTICIIKAIHSPICCWFTGNNCCDYQYPSSIMLLVLFLLLLPKLQFCCWLTCNTARLAPRNLVKPICLKSKNTFVSNWQIYLCQIADSLAWLQDLQCSARLASFFREIQWVDSLSLSQFCMACTRTELYFWPTEQVDKIQLATTTNQENVGKIYVYFRF